MNKVLYVTNLPAPYKVLFFEKIGMQVDLTVIYESSNDDERDDSWFDYSSKNFKVLYLQEFSMKGKLRNNILKFIKEQGFNKIVISCYATMFERMLIRLFKRHRIAYAISSDGGFKKSDFFVKKYIKKFYLSGAEYYFSPNNITDKYLRYYGAKTKIHRYPFTSISNSDIRDFIKFNSNQNNKIELRKKLGIVENKVVVGVGSFTFRKGWDILLNAISDNDVGYYIIGGKPPQEYIDIVKKKGISHVHFIDFCDREHVFNYYRAADVFCLPTREDIWGLVINEAMANGLPVITTYECNAGLTLVKDEFNGYLFSSKSLNPSVDLSNLLYRVLFKDNLNKMSLNSLNTISNYTIENMAKSYLEVLK